MLITPLYTAALALFLLALTIHTIRQRRRVKVGFGDGGDSALLQAIRAHAHFTESVPFLLLAMMMLEYLQASPLLLHILGVTLLSGRFLHAYSLIYEYPGYRFRIWGMMLGVMLPLVVVAVALVLYAL